MNPARFARSTYPTLGELHFWLHNGKRGEVFLYHLGLLALDRGPEEKRIEIVDAVALLAWSAHMRREVVLVQQRIGENEFAYLAVKR